MKINTNLFLRRCFIMALERTFNPSELNVLLWVRLPSPAPFLYANVTEWFMYRTLNAGLEIVYEGSNPSVRTNFS